MNTPEYWGHFVRARLEDLLETELPAPKKASLEASVAQWVLDIREDELATIIQQIEEMAEKAPDGPNGPSCRDIIRVLKGRLPKRP